ncbi:MAG TPA: DUF6496 domain-containing protein [Candidatus Baltobacteraceae bacterium]
MATATKRKKTAKKAGAKKKTSGRKKSAARKYSPAAGETVHEEMHEFKEGTARSGRAGAKVKSRKQAIAIGLSEARKKGEKVPSAPKRGG